MNLTIAYITARKRPMLEWLYDGILSSKNSEDSIDLIVVDFHGRMMGELLSPDCNWALARQISSPFHRVITSPPKPTIWQGKHRLTSQDYWAASNARNTALCLCDTDYIAFVDDRCKLEPSWYQAVRYGYMSRGAVLAGPYDKTEDTHISYDHRRKLKPQGLTNCGGGWLFGGNFALPLEWALNVNGFEEGCDSVGGEDYIFGQMLCNYGYRIDFYPNMGIQQDRTSPDGNDHPFPRKDKGISPKDKSHAMMTRWGKAKHTEFTQDLRDIRRSLKLGNPFPEPMKNYEYKDWYDGQPIKEF